MTKIKEKQKSEVEEQKTELIDLRCQLRRQKSLKKKFPFIQISDVNKQEYDTLLLGGEEEKKEIAGVTESKSINESPAIDEVKLFQGLSLQNQKLSEPRTAIPLVTECISGRRLEEHPSSQQLIQEKQDISPEKSDRSSP